MSVLVEGYAAPALLPHRIGLPLLPVWVNIEEVVVYVYVDDYQIVATECLLWPHNCLYQLVESLYELLGLLLSVEHVVQLPMVLLESHMSPCAVQIGGRPDQQIYLLGWAEFWEVDGSFFTSLPQSLWLPVEQCVVAVVPGPV